MTSRRTLKIGAALAAASLTLAACGGSSSSKAVGTSSGGKVTLSMFGGQPPSVTNIQTNWFTKYLESRFDVKFNWDLVAQPDIATKQPLLLESGNYPDVIWDGAITEADALKYGTEGVFIPLNNLIKTYAPNVWAVIQQNPSFKQDVTAPNGNIYTLSQFNAAYHHNWDYQYFINIKDLEKYKIPVPHTTAQFEAALAALKAHGLTPLSGNSATGGGWNDDIITFLMNSFIPYNGSTNYLDEINGKLVFAPSTTAWRNGLSYLHTLYSKGFFSESALTQEATQVEQLISQQKVAVVPTGYIQGLLAANDLPLANDWAPMEPLRGPGGVADAAYASPVAYPNMFAITNKASKSQAIAMMKMLNFMFTPLGTEMYDFGPQGKDWTPAKKGQTGLAATQAKYNSNWNAIVEATTQNVAWNQWGPDNQSVQWWNEQYMTPAFAPNAAGSQENAYLLTEITMAGHQPTEQYPVSDWVQPANAQSYSTTETNIDNYVAQNMDEFITGQKSLTSGWTSYVRGLQSLQLAAFIKTSASAAKPISAGAAELEANPKNVKALLSSQPVPSSIKQYLLQVGVPASDFRSGN